jgi:predicted dehydrogenase
MMHRLSRRAFLQGSASTLAALAASGVPLEAAGRQKGAGEKVRLGIIGVGGQGEFNWSNLASQEIVALCDVDLARVATAARRFPNAEVVQDFRRVIDRKDIDAVVVSTPDHWHAIISVWAMQTGKHVYCEKPLAHSIYECRVMAETARQQKLVTQMGTQIHAGSNYRRVVEHIRAGTIGPVRRVDVWCEKQPEPGRRAAQGTPPPTLDYDLWVGPAPMMPYNPRIIPFHWRWWWEYGGGVLADMACHFMDLPHWALDLRHPLRVSATGTEFLDADNKVPVEMRVDYYYPARGTQPPVHLVWRHGVPGPRDEAGQVLDLGMRSGVLFHGEQGQLVADYGGHRLVPEEKFRDTRPPAPSIPESIGHHLEWIRAIREGGTTTCNFDYSGALSETVLLGNLAYRLGQEVHWDARLKVFNCRAADGLIQPPYRGDWRLRR